jgi:iron complex transport system substrate-binding protein
LVPCQDIAALSSTHIGMLSVLDAENTICAVSDSKLVYNPAVKKALQSGSILSLGDSQEISIEALISSGAKIIVHSAFSGDFPHMVQLKKMGLACIPNFDWREEDPLGKAEWILLFGYLTGKEELAKKIISEISLSYNQTLKNVKNQSTEKVVFGNFISDYWYAPAGESFNARLIRDAGMNYIYNKTEGTGSVTVSMEKIFMDTKDVKYWINPGFSSKAEILKANPKAKSLNCFNNGEIYCYSHDLNKFWELSAIQPHLVLADLYSIITVSYPRNLNFYKELR